MRRKNHIRLNLLNFRNNLFNRSRSKRRRDIIPGLPRLHHGAFGGKGPGLENLAPTVREPPVPHHQCFGIAGKLSGHGLHAIGSAARDQRHAIGVIHLFEHPRDIAHNLLK